MMRYTCQSCRHGDHSRCAGKNPPPPGMMGGDECDCDGNCAARAAKDPDPQIAALLETAGDQPPRPKPRIHLHDDGKVLSIGFEDGRGDTLLSLEFGAAKYPADDCERYPDGDMARLRDWVAMVKVAIGRSELPPEEQALVEQIFLLSAGADWQRRSEGAEARVEQLERAIAEYLVTTEFPVAPPTERLRAALASEPLKGEIVFDMIERWREDAKRPWRRGQGSRG